MTVCFSPSMNHRPIALRTSSFVAMPISRPLLRKKFSTCFNNFGLRHCSLFTVSFDFFSSLTGDSVRVVTFMSVEVETVLFSSMDSLFTDRGTTVNNDSSASINSHNHFVKVISACSFEITPSTFSSRITWAICLTFTISMMSLVAPSSNIQFDTVSAKTLGSDALQATSCSDKNFATLWRAIT